MSALSGGVAKSRQTLLTFPSPPLKFRTAGFPASDFKLDYSVTTLPRPKPRRTYTRPSALRRTPEAHMAKRSGPLVRTVLSRGPSLPPGSSVRRSLRYYGLIRASPEVRERVPNFVCLSVPYVPPPVARRSEAIALESLPALHHQGRLRSSFHRQDKQPYGLRATVREQSCHGIMRASVRRQDAGTDNSVPRESTL